jgi:anti-sigma regulatory factor (Ser/Thr protein kinase)
MFYARLTELRRVSAFLEGYCASADLEREHCLKINVILEELFINTVRHGHRGDCDAPVWMALEAGEKTLQVTYEDTAPPFNPYARLPLAKPDTTAEMRKIGGLGVLLTRELAAKRDYAYVFGRNRIRLALDR